MVNGAEHRLEGAGENGRFGAAPAPLLPFAQTQPRTEIHLRRFFRQTRGIDERGAHLGKIALAAGRKSAHQEIAHRQIEHRIAEKFQNFVVAGAVIALVGNMGERAQEKRRIGKPIAQLLL